MMQAVSTGVQQRSDFSRLVVDQLKWHQGDHFLIIGLFFMAITWALNVLLRGAMHLSPLTFVSACFVCGASLYITARTCFQFYRRSQAVKDLPGPKYPWLLGFFDLLTRRDVHRYATELAERYGPIFKFRIICFHCVMITDPVLATQVLRSKVVDKLRFQYSFLDPFLGGQNMLSGHTNGHWKAVRKAVAPAFSAGNIKVALGHIVDRSLALVEYLRESGPSQVHNMDALLLRESMDVIGRVGFQREMNALSSLKAPDSAEAQNVQALLKSTHEIELRVQQINRWWRLWRPDVRQGWAMLARFRGIVWSLLEHIKVQKPTPGSFADLLLKARDAKGRPLTDKQMMPEIAALFFAGIDTTGHTGCFVLYLISQHPEVEAKILAELDSLGLSTTPDRPRPRDLTYADLGRMPYLQAVIKEALRMYPPVAIGQVRVSTTHDITLAGKLHLPAGTVMWIPHHAIQNVSFNWDDPDKFQPERWLTPGTEYAVPEKLPLPAEWYKDFNGAAEVADTDTDAPGETGDSKRPKRYFPFAEGPRNCVGQSLAKVSLAATMAVLLQHFSFRLADEMGGPEGVRKAEQYTLVTGLANGMLMHAIPRTGPGHAHIEE